MILITGSTGFVGQRIIREIAKNFPPTKLLCLTWNKDFTNKNWVVENNGRELLKRLHIKTRDVDLVANEGLSNLPAGIELVINIAANTNTSDPDQRCNDEGVQNLLNSLERRNKSFHFIQISTIAFMAGRIDCSEPISEFTEPKPTNEYGRSKLRAEKYLTKKCVKDRFSLTIIRLNTVYGEGSRPDSMFELLEKWVRSNSLMSRINWPGLTSIVYADDVARTVSKLCKHPPKLGQATIHTLCAESLSLADICKQMYDFLGIDYRPIILPAWVWKIAAWLRKFIPIFELLIPTNWYNSIWRLGLIVDDVVWCSPIKKYKKLSQVIKSVLDTRR